MLGLNTDEFYTDYINDPVLNDRVKFLDAIVGSKDDLLSIAAFSIIEGAILFSSFAMFKNFQSNGNNLLGNVVQGINNSVLDEGLHQQAGAALFRQALSESDLSESQLEEMWSKIYAFGLTIKEHEDRILDMFYEKGGVRGTSLEDLKTFVGSRVDICIQDLGGKALFKAGHNPVADWFYKGVQKMQSHDFFAKMGREYQRGWSADKFTWNTQQDQGE